LGTLILEGDGGEKARAAIAANEDAFIEAVAAITEYYGFDGWVLNFGWGKPVDAVAGGAEAWVKKLTAKVHEKAGQNSTRPTLVIAYPYTLNNKSMLAAADGIFTDWGETEKALKDKNGLSRLASVERAYDVYMGFDAFGSVRQSLVPTEDDVAACLSAGLSVAIFAPGFTLEVQADKNFSKADGYENRFWTAIGNARRKMKVTRRTPKKVTRPAVMKMATKTNPTTKTKPTKKDAPKQGDDDDGTIDDPYEDYVESEEHAKKKRANGKPTNRP